MLVRAASSQTRRAAGSLAKMRTRKLGSSDVEVTEACLGTMVSRLERLERLICAWSNTVPPSPRSPPDRPHRVPGMARAGLSSSPRTLALPSARGALRGKLLRIGALAAAALGSCHASIHPGARRTRLQVQWQLEPTEISARRRWAPRTLRWSPSRSSTPSWRWEETFWTQLRSIR